MNILLLNLHYPTEAESNHWPHLDIAAGLAERHNVTVLSGRPYYDPKERHPYYLFRRRRQGSLTVERVGSTAFQRQRMWGRIANYLSYLALGFLRALMRRPKPDVIIAMSDPPLTCLIGVLAAKVRRCPLVYNIRDILPDAAVAVGLIKPGLLVSLWQGLHHWALRQSRLVIVLGEDMRDRVVAKGVKREQVVVVRDGARPLEIPSNTDHPVTRQIRGGTPFVAVHAGNLGFSGAWDTLLEAAGRLQGSHIDLVFIGDGTLRSSLEHRAKGLKNVRFLPFYPAEALPYVLASADLHIVTIRRGLEGLVVPSKLYPILMAKRPVLAVTPRESDVARIVQQYGCGLVADPEDPEDVARALVWARDNPNQLTAMAQQAAAAGWAFHRKKLVQDFVQAVESVFNPDRFQQTMAPKGVDGG